MAIRLVCRSFLAAHTQPGSVCSVDTRLDSVAPSRGIRVLTTSTLAHLRRFVISGNHLQCIDCPDSDHRDWSNKAVWESLVGGTPHLMSVTVHVLCEAAIPWLLSSHNLIHLCLLSNAMRGNGGEAFVESLSRHSSLTSLDLYRVVFSNLVVLKQAVQRLSRLQHLTVVASRSVVFDATWCPPSLTSLEIVPCHRLVTIDHSVAVNLRKFSFGLTIGGRLSVSVESLSNLEEFVVNAKWLPDNGFPSSGSGLHLQRLTVTLPPTMSTDFSLPSRTLRHLTLIFVTSWPPRRLLSTLQDCTALESFNVSACLAPTNVRWLLDRVLRAARNTLRSMTLHIDQRFTRALVRRACSFPALRHLDLLHGYRSFEYTERQVQAIAVRLVALRHLQSLHHNISARLTARLEAVMDSHWHPLQELLPKSPNDTVDGFFSVRLPRD